MCAEPDRGRFLPVTGAAGVTTDPLTFAGAAAGGEWTTLSGRFEPGAPDWVYVPVRIPAGVREIAVRYTYDTPQPGPSR